MEFTFWKCGGTEHYCEQAGSTANCCPTLHPSERGGWYATAYPAIYSCDASPHNCSSFAQLSITRDSAAEREQKMNVELECTRENQPTVKVQKEVQGSLPVDLHAEEVPWNSGYTCQITVDPSGAHHVTSSPAPAPSHKGGNATIAPSGKSNSWLGVAIFIGVFIIAMLALLAIILAESGISRSDSM